MIIGWQAKSGPTVYAVVRGKRLYRLLRARFRSKKRCESGENAGVKAEAAEKKVVPVCQVLNSGNEAVNLTLPYQRLSQPFRSFITVICLCACKRPFRYVFAILNSEM